MESTRTCMWRVTWSVLGRVLVSMLIGKEVSLEASGNRHVFIIPSAFLDHIVTMSYRILSEVLVRVLVRMLVRACRHLVVYVRDISSRVISNVSSRVISNVK